MRIPFYRRMSILFSNNNNFIISYSDIMNYFKNVLQKLVAIQFKKVMQKVIRLNR
jgi:hypothetical protein